MKEIYALIFYLVRRVIELNALVETLYARIAELEAGKG